MRHWHRCARWWKRGEPCPFVRMEEHEPDEGEPPDEPGGDPRLFAPAREQQEATEGEEALPDPVGAIPFQVPLPFPFPIPEPVGVPQLPGMPAFRPPRPSDVPEPVRPLPGQPALPDPGRPPLVPVGVQTTGEGALNLVGGALHMVPSRFRATGPQMAELFGAFKARVDDPPLRGRFGRIAVAEEGAARIVESARRQRARVSKKRLAAGAAAAVAGAGVAFGVHRSSTGGFGGLRVNMAAELARLTSAVGSRREQESGQTFGFGGSTTGSEL